VVRALLAVAVVLVLILVYVWLTQRRMIYFPMDGIVPPAASVLPRAQEVSFDTEDGLQLRGWFVPARHGGRAPAALVFNGNAGNRSHRAPLAAALSDLGLAVLLFDYRGYGGQDGAPSESGLAKDARAARRYLESRTDVDSDRILYYGESLGSAVAVAAAAERAPAALVLRSPFTSLTAIGRLHYPYLPVGLLLADRYPAGEQIISVKAPLLVIAGEGDRIIPHEESRRLFEAAAAPLERFVTVPRADHNDPELVHGAPVIEATRQFLAQTMLVETYEEDR
jgi:fermentation-respiration switch protein FrsA (DUF1100 family)